MVPRLDTILVERGLARSRGEARDLIEIGVVTVSGVRAIKASTPVTTDTRVEIHHTTPRFVSRAGRKLDEALARWPIVVEGRTAIDIGASTGGFTDVLLRRGAHSVVCLDVGRGQLSGKLASDPRVVSLEGVNIRDADVVGIGGPFDLVTVDLSFISLTVVADQIISMAGPGADMVVLVKPQFEVGRAALGSGGVVRDHAAREEAVAKVSGTFADGGVTVRDTTVSSLTGSDGNVEHLLWLVAPR